MSLPSVVPRLTLTPLRKRYRGLLFLLTVRHSWIVIACWKSLNPINLLNTSQVTIQPIGPLDSGTEDKLYKQHCLTWISLKLHELNWNWLCQAMQKAQSQHSLHDILLYSSRSSLTMPDGDRGCVLLALGTTWVATVTNICTVLLFAASPFLTRWIQLLLFVWILQILMQQKRLWSPLDQSTCWSTMLG